MNGSSRRKALSRRGQVPDSPHRLPTLLERRRGLATSRPLPHAAGGPWPPPHTHLCPVPSDRDRMARGLAAVPISKGMPRSTLEDPEHLVAAGGAGATESSSRLLLSIEMSGSWRCSSREPDPTAADHRERE